MAGKTTFASKTFASSSFASGTWNGVGSAVAVAGMPAIGFAEAHRDTGFAEQRDSGFTEAHRETGFW